MENKTVKIPNISCKHCTGTIERELGDLAGVSTVKAQLDSKMVTVEWQEPADWDGIRNLLEEINFPPEI